jgi:dipeptidyl aminopeptidase/acylaminoacyl peptidase
MTRARRTRPFVSLTVLVAALALSSGAFADGSPLTFEQLAAIRTVTDVKISPDGRTVAYTLSVPRKPGVDDDGPAWVELHVQPANATRGRAFVRGEVNVSQVEFSPDGEWLTYVAKREDDEHRSLWAIPVNGGESVRLVEFESNIADYAVAPDGQRVAIVATQPEDEGRKKAKKKGYKQEVFEEDSRPRQVWIAALPSLDPAPADPSADEPEESEPQPFEIDGSAFEVAWSPDGGRLALTLAASPRIDDRYMHRRIHVFDPSSGAQQAKLDNPGKLGPFAFSPDGNHVAMISAADPNDPKEGRLMLAASDGGDLRDLLPDLPGHVQRMAWRDDSTVMFIADMGAETEFGEVDIKSGERKIHLAQGTGGGGKLPVLTRVNIAGVGKRVAFVGESPAHPAEVFTLSPGESTPKRLTNSNPWLDRVALARQEVIRHETRDGLELEGILIRPLEETQKPAPLMMIVHGGPESHVRNGWVTSYSRPGQLAAGAGYAVFYPNYRGSTGRGVEFSKTSQGDAAGKEFDDLVEAVDHLVAAGIADRNRVGITGGSYGGYATAWCSTRFSERFKAGVMFVGISNKVSKGLTTEIPVEDKMVHTLFDPWTKWQFSLERSPIYHVEKSRTALLIAGGTADSRVHPSQSLQLYRALKLIGKAPVRYVRYPGEGHGNRNAAARDDYARRLIGWMDHFVRDLKQDLPPWDLGLGVPAEDEPEEG